MDGRIQKFNIRKQEGLINYRMGCLSLVSDTPEVAARVGG